MKRRLIELKNPNIFYNSLEEFWSDHDISVSQNPLLESSLLKFIFKRERVKSTICKKEGCPYYEVTYRNRETYYKHMDFLKRVYKLSEKRISPSELHFVHEQYIVIDTIHVS